MKRNERERRIREEGNYGRKVGRGWNGEEWKRRGHRGKRMRGRNGGEAREEEEGKRRREKGEETKRRRRG